MGDGAAPSRGCVADARQTHPQTRRLWSHRSGAQAVHAGWRYDAPANPGAYRSLRIYDISDSSKQNLYAALAHAQANPTDGIFDSGLAAHPSSALGLALINDSRGSTYLLIRPTRIGDLNLDGAVTISDFLQLASHFGASGAWEEGDLNYDGQITISDFLALASNFGSAYSGVASPISTGDFALLNDFASAHGVTMVPEPSTFFVFLILAFAGTLRRLQRPASTNPTLFPTARS